MRIEPSYIASNGTVRANASRTILPKSDIYTKEEIDSFGFLTEIPSEYVTDTELQSSLSDYVTDSQLQSRLSDYVTYSYLDSKNYLTQHQSLAGYATETYVTDKISQIPSVDLTGYATESYVVDYVTTYGGGSSVTIDENIIPKETNTYTLGDSTYLYNAAYTNNLFMDGHSITYRNSTSMLFSLNNRDSFVMMNNSFCPSHTGINLGINYASNKWANIYADNTYSTRYNFAYNTWFGSDSNYEVHIGVNNQKRFQMNMYQFYQLTNPNESSLGVNNFPWAYTYTKFLIGQNAYISNAAYLPVNTYQYDGSTYNWLGEYATETYVTNAVNAIFSFDSTTNTLTINTL